MKSSRKVVLCLVLVLVLSFMMREKLFAADYYTIANLNMREDSSIDSNIITTIPNGTKVDVVEYGEWSRVNYNGRDGYVSSKYISDSDLKREYLGQFRITHYCTCEKCCGKGGGKVTYSGTVPTRFRTIAVSKSQIPLGSSVFIDGYGIRIAEDTGSGIHDNCIDIFAGDNHEYASELGIVYRDVWILKGD